MFVILIIMAFFWWSTHYVSDVTLRVGIRIEKKTWVTVEYTHHILPASCFFLLSPSLAFLYLGQLISRIKEYSSCLTASDRKGAKKKPGQPVLVTSGLPYLQEQRHWLESQPTQPIWLFPRLPIWTSLVTWNFCFHFSSCLTELPYSIFLSHFLGPTFPVQVLLGLSF